MRACPADTPSRDMMAKQRSRVLSADTVLTTVPQRRGWLRRGGGRLCVRLTPRLYVVHARGVSVSARALITQAVHSTTLYVGPLSGLTGVELG
jgi:hypothetical protein